jgi:hypothetical protein
VAVADERELHEQDGEPSVQDVVLFEQDTVVRL